MIAGPVHGRGARAPALSAAVLVLALAGWSYRVVLPAPATVVPAAVREDAPTVDVLSLGDQRYVIGNVAINARKVVSDPTTLYGPGPCFPLERPFTLGEHMFGEGLLGALPWALTHEPILTYNVVLVASAWIAAMSMYALVFSWTRSALAALVTGLLFAFHPARIGDPAHPYVYGNLWTPLALLFAQRLFVGARWRDALGLSLVLCLQLLESFYQVLALVLLGGIYGAALLARHAHAVRRLATKLLFVVLATSGMAALVFGPYLATRATWGVLQGRAGAVPLYGAADYLPGGIASVGWVPLLLACVGLLDRVRRRDVPSSDPRLVLLAAGLVVWWTTLDAWRLPLIGLRVPSPVLALAGWVPGLDSVRVLRSLRFGVFLVVDLLAAFGVVALISVGRASVRVAMSAALVGVVLLDVVHPLGFAARPALVAAALRPGDDVVAAYRSLPAGAVLDLPVPAEPVRRVHTNPIYVLLAAFHGQPVAACYNSFTTALQDDVRELARRLPDARAADALYALGFRTIVVHGDLVSERAVGRLRPLLDDPARITPIARASDTSAYRLRTPVPIAADIERLVPSPVVDEPDVLSQPGHEIEFAFWNPADATYVHPAPIEPAPLIARWRDVAGQLVAEQAVRTLLPAALGAGQEARRRIALQGPGADGAYEVELVRASAPDRVVARRRVDVRVGAPARSGLRFGTLASLDGKAR